MKNFQTQMEEKTEEFKKLTKPLILIVDDVPKNLQVLGTILKKIDCELAVALNGEQALNTVGRIKPDLILLDIMMPGMDGYEVCRRLKANEETSNIPVIFLSARNETEDVVKGFELGAVDYISKPILGVELLTRVKTNLALKQLKDELQEQLIAKNKFFSIISHDLLGSFGIILSFIQLLQKNRKKLPEREITELLADIESSAQNSLDLLENLLEWARSQSGGIRFKPVELNLEAIIGDIFKSMFDVAQKKQIALKSTVNGQSVFADRNMLMLIFRNLVSNAVKFTSSGGKVTIDAVQENNSVKISVIDNGVGIEHSKIEQLFKIDNKVSTPGTDNEQGNGLGLILCREFLQYHNGRIGVESTPKNGTTVWFTLPLNENGTVK